MKELDNNYFKTAVKPNNKDLNSYLRNDEKVLWKARPKKSSYATSVAMKTMPIGILWLLIDVSIIVGIFANVGADTFPMLFLIPFFALHLFPFWIWLFVLIKSYKKIKGTTFAITNKRIIKHQKTEYLNNVDYINISDITEVKIHRGFIDKILFVGDITILGKDKTIELCDIYKCKFIYKKLMALTLNKDENDFITNAYYCSYCDSTLETTTKKCPYCGARVNRHE